MQSVVLPYPQRIRASLIGLWPKTLIIQVVGLLPPASSKESDWQVEHFAEVCSNWCRLLYACDSSTECSRCCHPTTGVVVVVAAAN